MKNIEKILGVEASNFFEGIEILKNEISPAEYHYMNAADFRSLASSDFKAANSQYWKEILFRSHFAASASLVRNYDWLRGMIAAYETNNFLLFCASFRSLIESTADSYDALNNSFSTLADNAVLIEDALNLKSKSMATCKELEDQLIHFSHGRKLEKNEAAPDSHNAKSSASYVKALDKTIHNGFYECYSELCQYVHPAAYSVAHMFHYISEEKYLFEPGFDKDKIEIMSRKYKNLMLPLMMLSFNPSLLCLKVLRSLSEPSCHYQIMDKFDLTDIKAWNKCNIELKKLKNKSKIA